MSVSKENMLADSEYSKTDTAVPAVKPYGVFTVGDEVSVWSAYGSTVESLAIVTKVGPRKMVLSDNSEWKANGSKSYGCAGYFSRSVRHRGDGDELNWLRNKTQMVLRAIRCERLEESDLRTLLAIAKRSEKPQREVEHGAQPKA